MYYVLVVFLLLPLVFVFNFYLLFSFFSYSSMFSCHSMLMFPPIDTAVSSMPPFRLLLLTYLYLPLSHLPHLDLLSLLHLT